MAVHMVSATLHSSFMAITRVWRGWTTPENAAAYEAFLFDELLPQVKALAGFIGAEILHRQDGDEISWVSLLRFESMDHVRAFAGASPERAVLEPKALALLSRHETQVRHFETRVLT